MTPDDNVHFITKDKLKELEQEMRKLKEQDIPQTAKRINEAQQMGDLSENAEYHAAREEMAWLQSRMQELRQILNNAELISKSSDDSGDVGFGSTVIIKGNGEKREYTIVGAQEANPSQGKISNESPLGSAFIGKKKGDIVIVNLPSGKQEYKILEVK